MIACPTIRLPDACETIALCGGPYSNFAAVEGFPARTAGLPRFCLGAIGGFALSLDTGVWTTCSAILPEAERVPMDRYTPAGATTEETDARHAAAAQGD